MKLVVPLVVFLLLAACAPPPEATAGGQSPLPPVDTLVAQLVAVPPLPPPPPDYDTTRWIELDTARAGWAADIRYATTNNFMGLQVYPCGRCFLRPPVAAALERAALTLQAQGYGLLLYDCYRPRPAQQKLWDVTPNPRYVTPPARGSQHNRGTAVDLTLTDLASGDTLDMGTPYDFFGPEAAPAYAALPEAVLDRRRTLSAALLAAGFKAIRSEWWHFNYLGTGAPLSDWEWPCPTEQNDLNK